MPTILQTRRLRLEPFDDAHFTGLLALSSDAAVMRSLGDGLPATPDEVRDSIATAKRCWNRFGFSWWALVRKDDDEIVGAGCVQHIDNDANSPVEIGWRLKREHWGHGYATEAAHAMIAFAFDQLGLASIQATTHPSNERSLNVIKRLGMRGLGLHTHNGTLAATYVLEKPPLSQNWDLSHIH